MSSAGIRVDYDLNTDTYKVTVRGTVVMWGESRSVDCVLLERIAEALGVSYKVSTYDWEKENNES